jgi:hypothetical protein
MGFVRLFGVVGQVLIKPHLLRDVDDEFHAFYLEEATVKRKLANTNSNGNGNGLELKSVTTADVSTTKLCAGLSDLYQIRAVNGSASKESTKLYERLREIEADKLELGEFL